MLTLFSLHLLQAVLALASPLDFTCVVERVGLLHGQQQVLLNALPRLVSWSLSSGTDSIVHWD